MQMPVQITIVVIAWMFCQALPAQQIRVKWATSQGWAGGISASQGKYYQIELEIVYNRQQLVLDSIWLDGYCRSLANYNPAKKNQKDSATIHISENIILDGWMELPEACYDPAKKGVKISYYKNQRKMWLDITRFMVELTFQGYP
jgi:hypothetical protein